MQLEYVAKIFKKFLLCLFLGRSTYIRWGKRSCEQVSTLVYAGMFSFT